MINFVSSSYEVGDTGGSLGHMETSDRGIPGYDLDYGHGSEPVSVPPNMQARGFRQERVIMSHDQIDANEDAFDHPDECGFRWRAEHDGV